MKVFIGLPVSELSPTITELHSTSIFQQSLRPPRIELHITIKAPQLIDDPAEWIMLARNSMQDLAPIQITTKAADFMTPFALAVMVESQAAQLVHNNLAKALAKYNIPKVMHYEFDKWTPHITIGRTDKKIDQKSMDLVKAESNLAIPPQTFIVRRIRLYGKSENLNYSTLLDIPLNGN